MAEEGEPLDADTVDYFDTLDLIYRTLCAVMYNYAPHVRTSGRLDLLRPFRRAAAL